MPDANINLQGKHVALFGFYKYGNYGDDLMGVIFGQELKARGVPFRVYQLHPAILQQFQFDGADSIDELLDGCSKVIYGGGGAFLAPRASDFESHLLELCDQCSRRNLPIYMFSVGGEGKPVQELSAARRELLDRAAFITFRNREDQPLLDRIGSNKGAIHHDIVWRTPDYFPVQRQNHAGLTIGIDNSLLHRRRTRWPLRLLMNLCRLLRKPYRFVTIVQARNEKSHGDDSSTVRYDANLPQLIEAIAQCDLVITHRLHLGITAMSYEIPVVQLLPHPKAAMLFNRLGLNRLVFANKSSLPAFYWFMMDEDRLRRLQPSQLITDYDRVVRDSKNHLNELIRILEPAAAN